MVFAWISTHTSIALVIFLSFSSITRLKKLSNGYPWKSSSSTGEYWYWMKSLVGTFRFQILFFSNFQKWFGLHFKTTSLRSVEVVEAVEVYSMQLQYDCFPCLDIKGNDSTEVLSRGTGMSLLCINHQHASMVDWFSQKLIWLWDLCSLWAN